MPIARIGMAGTIQPQRWGPIGNFEFVAISLSVVSNLNRVGRRGSTQLAACGKLSRRTEESRSAVDVG